MAKTAKEVTLNGNRYLIGMFGPDEGDEVIAYLAKTFGPLMAALSVSADKDVDSPDVGKAISGALANVSGREHAGFMRRLLSVCTVNGVPAPSVYETHYLGNHAERYQAAVEVIRHNGFFDLVAELKGNLSPASSAPST